MRKVLAFEFFNRQLQDPKGRSCSEGGSAGSPSEFSKIADTGIYLSKNVFDETGGESKSKEIKTKINRKLQIMSLEFFFAIENWIQNLSGYPGTPFTLEENGSRHPGCPPLKSFSNRSG